ncbi:MAG: hypothetical protein Q9207_001949 [Kuettlingeria erythrocarpa]
MKLGKQSSIAAWRMLFIVEGFPSVIISVYAFYYIPNTPWTARYLTKRERRVAELRLRQRQKKGQQETSGKKFEWDEIWEALKDPKYYVLLFLPVFLPTIIEDMGYSALRSQALSAPPYLVAFIVVLVTAYYSDKYHNRGLFICFHALLAAGGYAMMTIAGIFKVSALWRYWAIYPAASGFFSAVTLLIAWTINNQDSDAKKGTGVAILNIIGQLGPFIGTGLYPETDGPFYIHGMAACTIFMLVVAGLSLLLRIILRRENTVRDAFSIATTEEREEDGLVDEDHKLVNRPSPFRYIL